MKCDCGSETIKVSRDLKHAKFCGHSCPLGVAYMSKKQTKHNMSQHSAYHVWSSMKKRCQDPSHAAYHNYGGRGIKVCASWLESFENFWADMGPTWVPKRDLDRVNNDGDYEPTNCRWTTRKENARNRRTSKIPAWALDKMAASGMSRGTFYQRVYRGWDLLSACTVPPDSSQRYSTFSTAAPIVVSRSDLPVPTGT